MKYAGIVLCGGQSRRMGWPKPMLPFGTERMLQRVVRLMSEVVDPIVVVSAEGQELPRLSPGVEVVHDRRSGRGPLEGLLAGLSALEGRAEAAYVSSCDVPLLVPAFVRRMTEMLGDFDVAVPRIEELFHPLSAVYRTRVRGEIEALLAADRLRPVFLYEQVATRVISADELADVDAGLVSLHNLNTPDDYLAALSAADLTAPPGLLAMFREKSCT